MQLGAHERCQPPIGNDPLFDRGLSNQGVMSKIPWDSRNALKFENTRKTTFWQSVRASQEWQIIHARCRGNVNQIFEPDVYRG